MDVAWLKPGKIWRDKNGKDVTVVCLARPHDSQYVKVIAQVEDHLLPSIFDIAAFLDGRFTYGRRDDDN